MPDTSPVTLSAEDRRPDVRPFSKWMGGWGNGCRLVGCVSLRPGADLVPQRSRFAASCSAGLGSDSVRPVQIEVGLPRPAPPAFTLRQAGSASPVRYASNLG